MVLGPRPKPYIKKITKGTEAGQGYKVPPDLILSKAKPSLSRKENTWKLKSPPSLMSTARKKSILPASWYFLLWSLSISRFFSLRLYQSPRKNVFLHIWVANHDIKDRTILGTAVPQITNEFNSFGDISWYEAGFLLPLCMLQLSFGLLYVCQIFSLYWKAS